MVRIFKSKKSGQSQLFKPVTSQLCPYCETALEVPQEDFLKHARVCKKEKEAKDRLVRQEKARKKQLIREERKKKTRDKKVSRKATGQGPKK